MFEVSGKVVVVTGAASGIGLATVERLSTAGATCVMADIVDCTEAASRLAGSAMVTDVSDELQVDRLVSHAVDQYGRIDVMVNNAGVPGPVGGVLANDAAETLAMIEVNLMSVIHGTKYAGAAMKPGGVIINTSSMAGVLGFPGLSAYGAAKAGVIGFSKHASVELGQHGVRVNCVCPTGVVTPFLGTDEPAAAEHWATRSLALGNQHVDRLADASEVAAAIHYLASDEAAMINGHALYLDGGLAAGHSVQLLERATGQVIGRSDGIAE